MPRSYSVHIVKMCTILVPIHVQSLGSKLDGLPQTVTVDHLSPVRPLGNSFPPINHLLLRCHSCIQALHTMAPHTAQHGSIGFVQRMYNYCTIQLLYL